MAATVELYEYHGTNAGTKGSINKFTTGSIRFKNADDEAADANNPMVKPTSGSDWSYEKWIRCYIGSTGPTGTITNTKFYTDGAFATGIEYYAKDGSTTGVTPAHPSSDSGFTSCTSYVSGTPLSIYTSTYSGTSTPCSNFLVIYMKIGTSVSAPQNPTTAETFTWIYDET